MMSKGILLSEKHGVNPSVEQCFFCMKEFGLILFGRMNGDAEAPRIVCRGDSCDECRGLMKKGVIFISVDEARSTDLNNPYRTGGWCVIKDDAVRRMISVASKGLLEDILKKRVAFVPDDAWDLMGLPRAEKKAKDGK